MRHVLAVTLGLLLLCGTVFSSPQSSLRGPGWVGWDSDAGLRLGAPNLTSPVLLTALPDGFNARLPGHATETVDILVAIEKDGRVKPRQFMKDAVDRNQNSADQRAWELVKTWRFEPGRVKNKPVDVAAILGIPVRQGKPLPPPTLPATPPPGFPQDLARLSEPDIVAPVRLMYFPPPYLPSMLARHIQGQVDVTIEVRADGRVGAAAVTKSLDPDADEVCLSVARATVFLPALRNGQPVGTWVVLEARLQLR